MDKETEVEVKILEIDYQSLSNKFLSLRAYPAYDGLIETIDYKIPNKDFNKTIRFRYYGEDDKWKLIYKYGSKEKTQAKINEEEAVEINKEQKELLEKQK